MDVATTTTAYDDRPISMYDNLNVTNNNVNTTSTPKIKQPSTTETSSSSSSSSTSPPSKPNGAVRSATAAAAATTPFAHITFKFNDNNNTTTTTNHQQHQQQQQAQQPYQMVNGNRNMNQQISPNMAKTPGSGVAALYATPFKMVNTPISQKPAITTSPPAQTAVPASGDIAGIGNALTSPLQQPSTTSSSSSSSSQTPAVAVAATQPSAAATATANTTRSQTTERPLSQHSQSELNETTHSIAAVKAALNEAKSKFFGLNGYAASAADLPQQLQHPSPPADESQTELLLPTIDHSPRIQPQQLQLQLQLQPQHHQRSAVQPPPVQTKPQPKYQNIPENSALFRNTSPGGSVAPELPPKPLEYQNLNKPATTTPTPSVHNINNNNNKSTVSSSPSPPPSLDTQNSRKMPDGTIYNQISLNDIDGPSHRSQTVYMATTVPQNIKGNKIAGRHTPTRSSLRHSRMLVVSNKHYEEIQHPNPMGFRQPNLARWLLILQIIIGVLLISLSIWIFVLSPNTPIQDNPYWCGLVLLITGIIGLILIRYHRIKRHKTREHCFIFLRMDSYVLALLSLVLCCVALIFAAIHYCRITASDTKCESVHMLIEHGSCVCTFNAPANTINTTNKNSTETLAIANNPLAAAAVDEREELPDNSYKFEYRDLSCAEVTGAWTTILGLSFIFNSVGFVISLAYMILLACCRSASKRSYTTVRTSTF